MEILPYSYFLQMLNMKKSIGILKTLHMILKSGDAQMQLPPILTHLPLQTTDLVLSLRGWHRGIHA
tara:strand:- start:252 stop:449 length:198 start_codon:yes stop_codon:yes gene_type:complete